MRCCGSVGYLSLLGSLGYWVSYLGVPLYRLTPCSLRYAVNRLFGVKSLSLTLDSTEGIGPSDLPERTRTV